MPVVEEVCSRGLRNAVEALDSVESRAFWLIVPENYLFICLRMDDPPCETVRVPVKSICIETL